MATKAKASKGTKLKRGDGGGTEVFTLVGEVKSFSGPEDTVSSIDATSFDSTAKEFISDGLIDGGEISLELNLIGNDVQQQGLRTDARNGTLRNFQLVLNDDPTTPTQFNFSAFVKSIKPAAGQSEVYHQTVSLKVSGLPTVTYRP